MSPSPNLPEQVLSAIRSVVGQGQLALHEPSFNGNEWRYLKKCLDSTYVSSVGEFVDRFESGLASFTGAKHAIAVVNGTAALHIALKLAGVGIDDEVLMPTLTFVATANAVAYCGAMPHFVECELYTLGVDTRKLRDYLRVQTEQRDGRCINRTTGRVIRALVPMHTFGHASDLNGLLALAQDYNIALIEDAAESLGSYYYGRHTGTFGLMGTLSFNGNKTITTGGGGAILTNDSDLARRAKHLTTTAKMQHRWEYAHDQVGFNYRLPNLNAALGCAQLEQLPTMLAFKRELFQRYREALTPVVGVRLMLEPEHCRSNYWLQTLVLDPEYADQLDLLLQITNDTGVMTRPVWQPMHTLKHFSHCPRMDLSVAEELSRRLINIPSSPALACLGAAR